MPNTLLSVILCIATFSGCGGSGKSAAAPTSPKAFEDEVVARVDSTEITAKQIIERASAIQKRTGEPAEANTVLDLLIDEAVLVAEGRRLELHKAAEIAEVVAMVRFRAAAKLFEADLAQKVPVEEQTLQEMYHSLADTAHLRRVVVATEAEAVVIRDRLNGGVSLADELKHSLDPSAEEKGGNMGNKPRGELAPDVAEFAFSAPLGRFGGPFRSANGWATMAVVKRQEGDSEGFEKRRESILRSAKTQIGGQAKAHYLDQLHRTQEIALDEEFLKQVASTMSATPEQAQHVIARVSGHAIRYGMILTTMRSMGMGKGVHGSGLNLKRSIANKLIDSVLLGAAAIEHGFGDDPEILAAVHRAEAPQLVAAMTKQLQTAAPPTPSEVERYYEEHKASFTKPRGTEAAHILVAEEKRALALYKRLVGGESFADLARQHSMDAATKYRGGLLGTFADSIVDALAATEPELAEALQSPVGEVGAPVHSKSGWHLVKVLRIVPESARPLKEVSTQIRAKLRSERGSEAFRAAKLTLRSKASVEVDAIALDRVQSLLL